MQLEILKDFITSTLESNGFIKATPDSTKYELTYNFSTISNSVNLFYNSHVRSLQSIDVISINSLLTNIYELQELFLKDNK